MFTAYYILAVGFGVFAAIVSLFAILKPNENFPGKFYAPIILVCVCFAVGTLAAVIHGGQQEVEHRKHEEQQKSGEQHEAASLPAAVAAVRAA